MPIKNSANCNAVCVKTTVCETSVMGYAFRRMKKEDIPLPPAPLKPTLTDEDIEALREIIRQASALLARAAK